MFFFDFIEIGISHVEVFLRFDLEHFALERSGKCAGFISIYSGIYISMVLSYDQNILFFTFERIYFIELFVSVCFLFVVFFLRCLKNGKILYKQKKTLRLSK